MNRLSVGIDASAILAGVALLGVAGAAFFIWTKRGELNAAFNPTKSTNLASQAAGTVVEAATGGAETSVGGLAARVREYVSGDDARIREMLKGGAASTQPDWRTPDFNPYQNSEFWIGAP